MRNGSFYLLCRVGDLRPTHLIGRFSLLVTPGHQHQHNHHHQHNQHQDYCDHHCQHHNSSHYTRLTVEPSESHVSAYVVKREVTEEGEEIPHHLCAIEFGTDLDGSQDFFQLFWPLVLAHKIDEISPLWAVSPEDLGQLHNQKFEIILTLEGTTPETGNNIQVRSRLKYIQRLSTITCSDLTTGG